MLFQVALLALVSVSYAAIAPPRQGFEQNVGQRSPDVLFALEDRVFYEDRVQLDSGYQLSLSFAGRAASVRPEGLNRLPYPLNLYLGTDPQRWKENVPHFSTIRYAQVYAGIDADWNTDFRSPMLRLLIAPGADPRQLQLKLRQTGQLLRWSAQPERVTVSSASFYSIERLSAYQPSGSDRTPVPVSFLQLDVDSFRPEVGTYDHARPLVIEFGSGSDLAIDTRSVKIATNGTAFFSGRSLRSLSPVLRGFLGAVSQAGEPAFLTLFDGVADAWIAPGPSGTVSVVGAGCCRSGVPPVLGDAPNVTYKPDIQDAWVARFDAIGRLRAATFVRDELTAFAADSAGDLYLATADSVSKWSPGSSSYTFIAPIRGVTALAPVPTGGVAFSVPNSSGRTTTPGAVQATATGPWDLYLGRLDAATGALRMATYAPIIGSQSQRFSPLTVLSVAPDSTIWVTSTLNFSLSSGYGLAHTLVAVSANGSRILRSDTLTALPSVSFDAQGNVFVVISTEWHNLPTSPDAVRRAGCPVLINQSLYLQVLAPSGAIRSATYLPVSGPLIGFDNPSALLFSPTGTYRDIERVDVRQPAPQGIVCVVNAASRQPIGATGPGDLITLVGHQLGPLEQANAPIGGTALQLAGVQVTFNGNPIPLVSAQQGLIMLYVPDTTPLGSALIEVWSSGTRVGSVSFFVERVFSFALFTADGSGRGPVAAINQDGTVNSAKNPAKAGTVVSFFATGAGTQVNPIFYGSPLAETVYDGPAPGLPPGVRQVNLLLPRLVPSSELSDGSFYVRVSGAPNTKPPTTFFVTP